MAPGEKTLHKLRNIKNRARKAQKNEDAMFLNNYHEV